VFRQQSFLHARGDEQLRALEKALQRKPDAIFAHKLAAMAPLLRTRSALPPIFLDLDDIEHVAAIRRLMARAGLPGKVFDCLKLPALVRGERRAIRLARRTFVCSETDRQYLANRWRLSGITTVPNAVTIPEEQPVCLEKTLLFIGSYRYHPNVEAAQFLIEKVWPRVLQAIPDASLIIAGDPPDRLAGYGRRLPGIHLTGFVDDLSELYARSRVVCAPIFTGGGTRIKIIEAAAFGKAIVATRLGAEGLGMRDGSELLLRDDVVSFSQACIDLLKDAALCERLGTTAYQAAISRYNRATIVQLIQNYINEAAQPQTVGEDKTAQAML
jgi:glycosyltransferase involved in cell wall biosynthesis